MVRQAELLKEELEALLLLLPDTPGLLELVREPLTKVNRGLAGESRVPWPLLPLIVCQAVSGNYERALPVAAALQLLRVAADVFDDIEDADSSESLSAKYGPAVATNAATTLLILAERAITRLKKRGIPDKLVVLVTDVINSYYTTACAGQHLDLTLTADTAAREDEYLKVASMKSATTAKCACHTGALLANAAQNIIDKFAKFGHNLGMASQIANDIRGITLGSDIIKKKMTLPLIYVFAQADDKTRSQLNRIFYNRARIDDPTPVKDLLFRAGAIHYTTVRMMSYKQRALDDLSDLEKAGVETGLLEPFME